MEVLYTCNSSEGIGEGGGGGPWRWWWTMEVVDSQQLRRCRFFVTVHIYPCMSPADTLHNSSEDVDRGGGGPWRWWTVEVVDCGGGEAP